MSDVPVAYQQFHPDIGWLPIHAANVDRAKANGIKVRALYLDGQTFQDRVQPWLMACFGAMIAGDREERNHRFLEEALELVQACGCSQSEAHQLVDYVYGRDQGDINQEVGGVMVTLAALCLANGFDMHTAGETELARIWTKVEKIRAKNAAKPKHSPLPGPSEVTADYCTFGPSGERKRQWIVVFKDADRGISIFTDEAEAHAFWEKAKDNWTCTLYETTQRKYQWAAGQLRPIALPATADAARMREHNDLGFVSGCCEGERCFCGSEAHHKVEETIFMDDPLPTRHPYTTYLCRSHFIQIMGAVAGAALAPADGEVKL